MSLLKMSYKMNVMELEEKLQGAFELPDVLHVLTRVFESKTCSLDKPIDLAAGTTETSSSPSSAANESDKTEEAI